MGVIGALRAATSVEVKDSPAAPGETLPRACPWKKDQPMDPIGDATSSYGLFNQGVKINPSGACHGYRPIDPKTGKAGPYAWIDYKTTKENVLALGHALRSEFGLAGQDTVGVFGKNSISWVTVQLAASSQGLILVPLYDTLGENAVEYVINHAEVKVLCVSVANAPAVFQLKAAGKIPSVQGIVLFGNQTVDTPAVEEHEAVKSGEAHSLGALVKKGKEAGGGTDSNNGALDDLFIIMYTSGTTGNPKGVKLLNRAIVSATASAHAYFNYYGIPFVKEDTVLSYLPLAHIYEQQAEANLYAAGGGVAFFQGDVKLLLDDLESLKPTMFVGVPRVYMRFQQRITENVESASGLRKMLFNVAYGSALRAEQNLYGRNFLWDAIVLNKIRNRVLPNARLMITGSAPMSAQTNDFLKVCLNGPLVQGYGLTESTGGFTCSPPYNSVSGTCGGPLPGCIVKLRDVPEMNYKTTDKPNARGEVMLKGDTIFIGYHKNDEETKKVLTEDGWFATGDIGQFLDDGSLQIIDRRKNLFKLSQGEYISPELLENEYVKCKLVGQIWVYGSSLEAFLVGVVVPDVAAAKKWATAKGQADANLATIVAMPGFKGAVLDELEQQRKLNNFKGFEAVKSIVFETEVNDLGQGFTVDNDLLTPTFKYKRPQLTTKYKTQLDELYSAGKK